MTFNEDVRKVGDCFKTVICHLLKTCIWEGGIRHLDYCKSGVCTNYNDVFIIFGVFTYIASVHMYSTAEPVSSIL